MRKLRQIFTTALMALTLLMWSNVWWGQALLVENFEYPEGTLLVNAGWAAHSGAGQSSIAVVSPGLTFSGYYGSGIGNAAAMIDRKSVV